jgi:hypothetical protein
VAKDKEIESSFDEEGTIEISIPDKINIWEKEPEPKDEEETKSE